MALHNTASDAANTAVRAFLTRVGEAYLGESFNLGSKNGKRIWKEIRDITFAGRCAYCGVAARPLQVEHLIMFNRTEFGLHHPGNVVPCCSQCQRRGKGADGTYMTWEEHLADVCERRGCTPAEYAARRVTIVLHANESDRRLPILSEEERHSIRVIAASLYEHVKLELEKSAKLYADLKDAFVIAHKG